jgi:type II secretory pathway component GspD/PulD (secretin)
MRAHGFRTAALFTAGLLAAAARAQEPLPPLTSPQFCPPPVAQAPPEKMVTTTYQVADLVIAVGSVSAGPRKAENPEKPNETAATKREQLVQLIQNAIAPKSWATAGGPGTIDYFPMTMTLVINQTPAIQEQVADLLAALRHLQEVDVALEVRLVTVSERLSACIGAEFNKLPEPDLHFPCGSGVPELWEVCGKPTRPGERPRCLNDRQVRQLLEMVQGDSRSNVMQAPKVTLVNSQTGYVDCTDKQRFVTGVEAVRRGDQVVVTPKTEDVVTGFRMSVRPIVSHDRRSVAVELDISQTDLAPPAVPPLPVALRSADAGGKPVESSEVLQPPNLNTLRVAMRRKVPDGGTVLLGGLKREVEVRTEYGPPVLSKVPYFDRMFKNAGTGKETQMVYVLVTPRVIVNEQQEKPSKVSDCARTSAVKAAELGAELKAATLEEAEPPAPARTAPACGHARALAELLRAYDEACAAGHTREAARLARAALVLDPTCFARRK